MYPQTSVFSVTLCFWKSISISACALWCASAAFAAEPTAADIEFFEKDVRPVFVEQCWDCHGVDNAESGLELDSLAGILRGGDRGPAINLDDPDKSLMLLAVNHADRLHMPPRTKIPQPEIDTLTDWVRRGAPWPGADAATAIQAAGLDERDITEEDRQFWAFTAVEDSDPPLVNDEDWGQSLLDRFIQSRLEEAGLTPAPAADKRTLIRRATFDLTGLPPTPQEVAAYLADDNPGAFERVINRLLASPMYGQRWGRHWLDVVRYGDSNGLDENLAFASAWRYRDYVIDAFNHDLPYDEFLREQIAGDLLPSSHSEEINLRRIVATGFFCLGAKMLAEDDPVKMQMDIIDEQLDTLGRATMGMTLGCARCHDHKFDPISMGDYYALAGILKSTRTMENFSVVARWQERPVATAEVIAQRDEIQGQVDGINSRIDEFVLEQRATVVAGARPRFREYLIAGARQAILARELADRGPLIERIDPAEDPTALLIEAEAYDRGNVLQDTTNYGAGIGVLVNRGETPNFVEYDIELDAAGAYQLDVRLAAASARPCQLFVDGQLIKSDLAGQTTGSWFPDTQEWFAETVLVLESGEHLIRLEHPQYFPHIDKLLLAPITDSPALMEHLGSTDSVVLISGIQHACSRLIDLDNSDGSSPFAAWRFFVEHGHFDGFDTANDVNTALLARPRPGTLPELADRYQQLLDRDDPIPELEDALTTDGGPFHPDSIAETAFSEDSQKELADLRAQGELLTASLPVLPETMAVSDGEPENVRIHLRGDHVTLGAVVERRFPRVIAVSESQSIGMETSGRLELADWLTDPQHPLTARVMVNRVWQQHFGAGLVRSPDNFGHLGEQPTHPELLDWLSARFVESDWSIKSLHRLIMTSAAWQQSTLWNEQAAAVDPENLLVWRMNRRRLEAEPLRDTVLAVGGHLDPAMRGSLLPTANRAYVTSTANVNPEIYVTRRRTVYLPVVRSAVHDYLAAFDFGDPSVMRGRRDQTTVAPQALFLMNSQIVADECEALAERLLGSHGNDEQRVQQLYETLFARPPTDNETKGALQFVNGMDDVWKSLCRALMMTNEFVYID